MRRRRLLVLAVVVGAGAPAVLATLSHVRTAERHAALLREVATAFEHCDYAGTAAWRRGDWEREVGIRNDADTGATAYRWGRRHRFVRADGPSHRMPDPAAWCLDVDALLANYRVAEVSPTYFLGRRAEQLRVEPRHRGRPRLTLTVDRTTRLPLKAVTYRSDGELYRVRAFRELTVAPQDVPAPTRRRRSRDRDRAVPTARAGLEAGFAVLAPDYLPRGFTVRDARVRDGVVPELRRVYTDGITAFEVRQEPVRTIAQITDGLHARYSARGARRRLDRWERAWMNKIVRQESAPEGGGVPVYRRTRGSHVSFELRHGAVDVRLIGRRDLAEEELLRVLRSLRPE